MESSETNNPVTPESEKRILEQKRDKDIEGEGFILKAPHSRIGQGNTGGLAKVEFRSGETTGKAHIRENLESEVRRKDWIKNYLKPGDFVQLEDRGFEEPKAVTKISEDRRQVFVEGSDVGIPIDQIRIAD